MKWLLSFLLLIKFSYAEVIKFPESKDVIIEQYLKLHKKYFETMCSPGTEQKFDKLLTEYRGKGFYVPVKNEKFLHTKPIEKYQDDYNEKIAWLKKVRSRLKKEKNFKNQRKLLKDVLNQVEKLLVLKKNYDLTDFEIQRIRLATESRQEILKLRAIWKDFIDSVYFFQNYKFPIDHYNLRKNFDQFKDMNNQWAKNKANIVYFYRKIVEDGAQNKDSSLNDKFVRATLSTITIQLDNYSKGILSEELRYDIETSLETIDNYLKRGPKDQHERITEWYKRTSRISWYYGWLLKKFASKNDSFTKDMLKKKSRATYKYKNYVYEKQARAYQFWTKQREIFQALYAFESILFNEVGSLDGRDALERKDVAQVILNRYQDSYYNKLDPSQQLVQSLKKLKIENLKDYPWLNLIFKKGEFSFTYFFIPANLKVFCPDMTKKGRFLRRENLRIAVDLIKKPNWNFKATRYFSRASMLGSIDMSSLWKNFNRMPDRIGKLATNRSWLRKNYRNNNYRYLYSFHSEDDIHFSVLEFPGNTKYVIRQDATLKQFYSYRNPHHFAYFSPKAKN